MEQCVQHWNDDQRQYRRKPESEHDGRGHDFEKCTGQQWHHTEYGGNRSHGDRPYTADSAHHAFTFGCDDHVVISQVDSIAFSSSDGLLNHCVYCGGRSAENSSKNIYRVNIEPMDS